MTKREIHIAEADWDVVVYDEFTCDHIETVKKKLEEFGCGVANMERAKRNMESCRPNTGITYSNGEIRKSVVVIYRTLSEAQHINTVSHEAGHVCQHISLEDGTDPYGEEICGIYGALMQKLYEKGIL